MTTNLCKELYHLPNPFTDSAKHYQSHHLTDEKLGTHLQMHVKACLWRGGGLNLGFLPPDPILSSKGFWFLKTVFIDLYIEATCCLLSQ